MENNIDDVSNIKSLLDEYLSWYSSRFTIKELKKIHELETPFVNQINDRISLFIEFTSDNKIVVSDDGITIDELEMHGVDLNVPTRKKTLNNILNNFKLNLDDDVIFTSVNSIKEFSQATHNLIQGILQINDILFTVRGNVENLFREEVFDFFFENDFGGTVGPDLMGASGIKHNVDYSIGGTSKRPQTFIKLLQDPNFTNVAAQKFISDDLKKGQTQPKMSVKYVIIANDTLKNIPAKSKRAAEDMEINMIEWTNKQEILKLK